MEGFAGQPPARLASDFWSPGWNSIQALNRFQEEIAGPLRGGDPGFRLLEPSSSDNGRRPFEGGAPEAFVSREGAFRTVGLDHVFGSDELSMFAPGVAALAPDPYVALSIRDLESLGIEPEGTVVIRLGDLRLELPARGLDELPEGVVGVPRGLPGLVCGPLPEWVTLERLDR